MKVLFLLILIRYARALTQEEENRCKGLYVDIPWCRYTLFTDHHEYDEAKCICERAGLELLGSDHFADLQSFLGQLGNVVRYPVWFGERHGDECNSSNSALDLSTIACDTNAQFVCKKSGNTSCFGEGKSIGTEGVTYDCCDVLTKCLLTEFCNSVMLVGDGTGVSQCYWFTGTLSTLDNYTAYERKDFVQLVNGSSQPSCSGENSIVSNVVPPSTTAISPTTTVTSPTTTVTSPTTTVTSSITTVTSPTTTVTSPTTTATSPTTTVTSPTTTVTSPTSTVTSPTTTVTSPTTTVTSPTTTVTSPTTTVTSSITTVTSPTTTVTSPTTTATSPTTTVTSPTTTVTSPTTTVTSPTTTVTSPTTTVTSSITTVTSSITTVTSPTTTVTSPTTTATSPTTTVTSPTTTVTSPTTTVTSHTTGPSNSVSIPTSSTVSQTSATSDYISTSTTESRCECPCDLYNELNKNLVPMTLEQAEKKAAELKSELKAAITVTNTSAYINSKISAVDNRTSAKSIGYVGVAILATIFGTIVLFDLPILLVHFRLMYRNICS